MDPNMPGDLKACLYLSVDGFDLLQGGEHKDGSLSHTRLGLAQDIHTKHSLK